MVIASGLGAQLGLGEESSYNTPVVVPRFLEFNSEGLDADVGVIESRGLGTGRFLLIYLISLFGGSAAVAIFAGDNTATAGASGAIYGLMGAMLVIVLKLKAPAGQVIAIIAINLLLSITVPGISLVGHVGGLVFGALATALALYIPDLVIGRQTPTVPLRKRATGTAWAALVVALVVAVALGIAAPALR